MSLAYQLVMLVEDNSLDVFIHQRLINLTGFAKETIVFNNVNDALAYLKSNQPKPELIFLDLHLPIANGFDFLIEFQQSVFNNIPVVMLTSSIDADDQIKVMEYPSVVSFISKPLKKELLQELLKRL
jgi:CheY-like chemotaxis protein